MVPSLCATAAATARESKMQLEERYNSQQGDGAGSSRPNPLDAAFKTRVEDTLEHWKVPGLAIAVIEDSQVFSAVGIPTRIYIYIYIQ